MVFEKEELDKKSFDKILNVAIKSEEDVKKLKRISKSKIKYSNHNISYLKKL